MATSKTMSTNYRFRIADSYTPASLPMERLAEYMAALARLLGEPAHVHFDGVRAGSAVLAMSVDEPAQPIVIADTTTAVETMTVSQAVMRLDLGDLPALGNLFRRKGNSSTKAELLVFVTPRILQVEQR